MTPKLNKYIKIIPTAKQSAFLLLNDKEVFFGGAAGGGKSTALLVAALQYVEYGGYNALLLRDSFSNLNKPGALIPKSHEFLANSDAHWSGDSKVWTFPSGATLTFGYLDGPTDHFNFLSTEYQFIGLDELCGIREYQALYMFSRLRRLVGAKDIPLRYRATSNPPARHLVARGAWVKKRYIDEKTREDRIFIPADMYDNPYLDTVEYTESLNRLDIVTRKQLRDGDWNVKVKGRMINREWFELVDYPPPAILVDKKVRYWDFASTKPTTESKDPDWTSGLLMSRTKTGQYYIENIVRFRKTPGETEAKVKSVAQMDGKRVKIVIEEEPGSAGKFVISNFVRKILPGWPVLGQRSTGNKTDRFVPFACMAENKNVKIVHGSYVETLLDELEIFPDGQHDDQSDACSGAFKMLTDQEESGDFPEAVEAVDQSLFFPNFMQVSL